MFEDCESFNQKLDIDTGSVSDMSGMFMGASTFNNGARRDASGVLLGLPSGRDPVGLIAAPELPKITPQNLHQAPPQLMGLRCDSHIRAMRPAAHLLQHILSPRPILTMLAAGAAPAAGARPADDRRGDAADRHRHLARHRHEAHVRRRRWL